MNARLSDGSSPVAVQLETSLLYRHTLMFVGSFCWVPSTPGQKSESTSRSEKQMMACATTTVPLSSSCAHSPISWQPGAAGRNYTHFAGESGLGRVGTMELVHVGPAAVRHALYIQIGLGRRPGD